MVATVIDVVEETMKRVHNLEEWEQEIATAKKSGILSFLRVGRALCAINADNLWQPVAPTFPAYVENSHGIKRSWAYSLIDIWNMWGEHLLGDPSLQQVEVTRLSKLLPLATAENREELLHMAASVPDARGFEDNLRNLKGKTATDDPHEHDFRLIGIEQCSICGLKRRVK